MNPVRWLDLASGKGQIIGGLKSNLSDKGREKLHFFGYDIENRHTLHAENIAKSMNLAKCDFGVGDLAEFHRSEKTNGPWNFITLTNAVHEISPWDLAQILVHVLERLHDSGCLYMYDMDQLSSPELGAVLWTGSEFSEVLATLCRSLGCPEYVPEVGTWPHRSCNGWNVLLIRDHMQLPEDWLSRTKEAVEATTKCIKEVLLRKLRLTQKALEALTKFGSETGQEATDKVKLLYDFFAITRVLEVPK